MHGLFLDIQSASGAAGQRVPVGKESITVGRHADNVIVLHDPRASRFHCVIDHKGGALIVRDLKSSNGTLINGKRITEAPFELGDAIQIGQARIVLLDESAAGDPSGDGELVELSELDLVEEAPAPTPMRAAARVGDEADDSPELRLEELAESLPNRTFGPEHLTLLNARGAVTHQATQQAQMSMGHRSRYDAIDVIRLLLVICYRSRATDIHLEPKAKMWVLRIRVDGNMVEIARFPSEMGVRLSALVKVLSDIDIAQKNIVQEGHFSAHMPLPQMPEQRVDYRISFAPSVFGQKLVIRVLDTSNAPLRVDDLELPKWMADELKTVLEGDSGMILISGPTGSGKTTSLYALIRSLDLDNRNVVTIEDPVEIQIEGATQIPVDEPSGRTFSALLRSVLRQDPDGILVGEIRDPETARIAMQAAITGHLVFSTVHTKDTIGTIYRLLDLGVEPYLVAQALHVVLAQRLARRLCPSCKQGVRPTEEQLKKMGPAGEKCKTIYVPRGCPQCMGSGHQGRRAIFELLSATDELRSVILKSPTLEEIKQAMQSIRFTRLMQSGYELVAEGIMSFDEVERAVGR